MYCGCRICDLFSIKHTGEEVFTKSILIVNVKAFEVTLKMTEIPLNRCFGPFSPAGHLQKLLSLKELFG